MPWRYNPIKRELHYYEGAQLRARYAVEVLETLGWFRCDHEALRRLPISTQ